MKVKICGMREPENIQKAAHLRIDMIGFIFYEKSSRFVEEAGTVDTLKEPIYDITSMTKLPKVGVFVDAEIEEVLQKVKDYSLTYVQLHGSENLFYCQRLQKEGLKIIKAFSIDEQFNFSQTKAYEHLCDYFVFDTKGANPGGNGVSFNWSLLNKYEGETPFLLSGGIGPESVTALRNFAHPKWNGIDLNSRFESKPGKKQIDLLKSFLSDLTETQVLKNGLPNWD